MRVIGTAGHVDHGKSTLVKALTGIDPDRLKEEKVRQMTIDLGFAWYQDISGEEIGIVDVPGHRDFIENMLSGISAIDAVLLVIAADEGVMPQTREHLAVLDLLKINQGIVVLTKMDLVQDLDWLELITEDIRKILQGTSLEGVEIVPVSAITGEGIKDLKTKISSMLASIDFPSTDDKARLPIDRVFSMQGFGTIVTGTLGGGALSTSEQVEIFPPGKNARIRGIQVHQKPVQKVFPGSRAALNLVGVEQSEIKRGGVVFQPGRFIPTSRIDTRVELLKDAGTGLKNNDVVKFFIATTETQARARVLGIVDLPPAGIGFVQFELSDEIIVSAHDRFILRRMSPAATIGGGEVINAHPAGRYRLNDKSVLEQLERRSTTNLEDQLLSIIEETPFISREVLLQRSGFEPEEFDALILILLQSNRVIQLTSGHYLSYSDWKELANKSKKRVDRFHQEHPLLVGLPFEVLCNQLGISKEIQFALREFFQQEGTLEFVTNHVRIPGREIRYSTTQTNRIKVFMDQIMLDPNNPPSVKGSKEILGEEVYESLIDQGTLIQISPEVVLSQAVYLQMVEYVIDICRREGGITVVGFRDHFSTNRKTSLGLLEHLDSKGITKRQGEWRVLIKP